jgi:hypothetical protein
MTRLLRTADQVMSAIGIAMLVLSLALVPINRSFADDGGGGYGPLFPQCAGTDGCNNGSCALQQIGNNCTTGTCPNGGGCSNCPCTQCWTNPNRRDLACDCMCETGLLGCAVCNDGITYVCKGSGHPCPP